MNATPALDAMGTAMRFRAHWMLKKMIEDGARHYERARHAPRLLADEPGAVPLDVYDPVILHADECEDDTEMAAQIGRTLYYLRRIIAARLNAKRRALRYGSRGADQIGFRQATLAELRTYHQQKRSMRNKALATTRALEAAE